MKSPLLRPSSSPGFKHFFSPRPLDTRALTITGIGVHERMLPGFIRRPNGTGDYLFMLFHDEVHASRDGSRGDAHPPETMMIWPPGAGQYYGHDKHAYSHSWIHCHGDKVRRWLRDTGLPVDRPFTVSAPALFSEGLMALHEELVSHVPPNAVIASNLLENILHELARRLAGDVTADVIEGRLLMVRRWIGTAPPHQVTLGQLAKMAGMSAPHFSASFKKAFGQSPITCLIVQRLTHAAHLLADRNQNISLIAERVGYDDPFHFSKAFKRHFGQSPRALRRQRHGW